jgi:hypothetical protein
MFGWPGVLPYSGWKSEVYACRHLPRRVARYTEEILDLSNPYNYNNLNREYRRGLIVPLARFSKYLEWLDKFTITVYAVCSEWKSIV